MHYFDIFDKRGYLRNAKPFPGLRHVEWRAHNILSFNSITSEQVGAAFLQIGEFLPEVKRKMIEEEIDNALREELDKVIVKLHQQGDAGIEQLAEKVLSENSPKISMARSVIRDYAHGAVREPDCQLTHEISDLDALRELLSTNYLDQRGVSTALKPM